MENKKDLSKKFWLTLIIIFLVLIVLVAVGFGIFATREDEVIIQKENGGNIVLNYSSNVSGLKLTNAIPTTNSVGIKKSEDGEYFDFSVDVMLDNAASIDYELSLVKDSKNSTIPDEDIRIYLEQEKSGTYTSVLEPQKFLPIGKDNEFGTKAGSMILTHVKKTKTATDHYRLRIWLCDTSIIANGTYSVEVVINGKTL